MAELNEKRKRFVQEYLIDLNATKAAERAGYSVKAARAIGSDLLANADIQAALTAGINARARRTNVTADKVIRELARIAFSDMSDFVEWGPEGTTLKKSTGLSRNHTRAVLEVSESWSDSGGSRKLKLHNKVQALELLGKHLGGMWKDKIEHTGPNGEPLATGIKIELNFPDNGRADQNKD